MGKVIKSGAAIALALAALFLGFREWRKSLYMGLSVEKIADIETGELMFMAFGIVLVVGIVLVLWAIKQWRNEPAQRVEPIIDAPYRVVSTQPAQPQLPGPRVVTAPIYRQIGAAQPLGATRIDPPETIVTTSVPQEDSNTPAELNIPLKYLYRFASLEGPTRERWTGKTTIYTLCRKFFMVHGFLDDAGKWREEYPVTSRKEWLEQFEPTAEDLITRTRTRE